MRSRSRHLSIPLALLLTLGIAACGDDDDDSGASASASGSASGSPAEDGDEEEAAGGGDFCTAVKAFNDAVFQVDLEDATPEDAQAAFETLGPLYDDLEATAPDGPSETIAELRPAIDGLEEGDAEAFNADETGEKYVAMLAEVVPDCAEETAEITAVDYAFEGVPETLPAGESGIVLVNDSEHDEPHEFIVFKKAEGDTRTAEEILNDPATQEQGPGEFSGAVFAGPGASGGGFLDLTAGDYIAVCFIPVGGGEDGPPHFTQGMVAEFRVA